MAERYYSDPRRFYDSTSFPQMKSLDDLVILIPNSGENKSRASSTGKLRESGKGKRTDFGEVKLLMDLRKGKPRDFEDYKPRASNTGKLSGFGKGKRRDSREGTARDSKWKDAIREEKSRDVPDKKLQDSQEVKLTDSKKKIPIDMEGEKLKNSSGPKPVDFQGKQLPEVGERKFFASNIDNYYSMSTDKNAIKTCETPLMATISEVFQETSDETLIRVLQDELCKLEYISKLLSNGNVSKYGETTFFFYFNKHDDIFEYYFKDHTSMGRIIGVGVEYAKVLLEDGWRLKVKETSKEDWENGLKNCASTSDAIEVIIPKVHETDFDIEDIQKYPTDIPRQRSLLLDIAKYFVLKAAIDSFPSKGIAITCTNSLGSASSSSIGTNQGSTNSETNGGGKLFQTLKNLFNIKAFNQVDAETDIGGSSGKDKTKENTKVYLELLPGGCVLDEGFMDDESKTLTTQLDNTICSEMQFTFILEENRKEIQIIVGPISFQFQEEQEENYMKTGRFGWFHKSFDVSFGVVDAECAKLCTTYKALDYKEVKETYGTSCTDATMNGIANTINGKVEGSVPQFLKLTISGTRQWSNDKTLSNNVARTIEEIFMYTQGGFSIIQKPNLVTSNLKYTYLPRDYMIELDHGKLSNEDHRKKVGALPICIPQDVKFQGTWRPNDLENDPHVLVEYTFEASRVVQMTSAKGSVKALKKKKKSFGRGKQQEESIKSDPLVFKQKYSKRVFLNHSMTHLDLNGSKYEYQIKERFNQRPLNLAEPETSLTEVGSSNPPSWSGNPLVELNPRTQH